MTTRTLAAVALITLSMAPGASAQTLTVAGSSSATVQAGPDFATTVMGDPWDFAQASDFDLMFSANWQSGPTLANGRVTGTVGNMPNLQLLFEGILGGLNISERTGVRFPINPSLYNRISYKLARTNAACDTVETIWIQGTTRTSSTVGGKAGPRCGFDQYYSNQWINQSPTANQANAGSHIYRMDLDGSAGVRSYGVAYTATNTQGLMLRLGENLAGSNVDLYWVRLSRRGVSTTTLAWSGFGGAVTLTATNGTDTIQIFPDDGTPTATFADNRSFTWDYGYLPAGLWTVTATRGSVSRSVSVNILAQPIVSVVNPSVTGGEDFAQAVIGDAWDLANSEDVTRWGSLQQISGASYSSSGLHASVTGLDNTVYFVNGAGKKLGTFPAIDAGKYRHLTYTIEFDEKYHRWDSSLDFQNRFGIARVIFQPAETPTPGDYTNSLAHMVIDGGPVTYTMDLGDFTEFGTCPTCHFEPGTGRDLWTGMIAVLRLDPMEPCWYPGVACPATPPAFRYANVKLTADEEPDARGLYTIRWSALNAASGTTLTIYAENRASSYAAPNLSNRRLVAQGVSPAAGEYSWYAGTFPVGRYFIHLELKNASGTVLASTVSEAPVAVSVQISDADLDGLPDSWEAQFGLSTASGVGDSGPSGDPDGDGRTNLQEFEAGTHPRGVAALARYFAEGAAGSFFDCTFALLNPGSTPANVLLRFLNEDGRVLSHYVNVPAATRRTVEAKGVPGLAPTGAFSTVIETDVAIIADRTMSWDGNGYGSHAETAIVAPAQTWYLAEGATHSGFDLYYCLQNPNAAATTVTVRYLRPAPLPSITKTYTLAANSRTTIKVNDQDPALASTDVSGIVRSNSASLPIIVERAMYLNVAGQFYGAGHNAAGVTATATDWFLAEGSTGSFFNLFVVMANPGDQAALVEATYLLDDGRTVTKPYTVSPSSRLTVYVNYEDPLLANASMSTKVRSTNGVPIIVERAMWWPGPNPAQWQEAHNSPGTTVTGQVWALADGEQGGATGNETYLCIANTSAFAGLVRVTLMFEDGSNQSLDFSVSANSRLTVYAGDSRGFGRWTANQRFGAVVESLSEGGQTAQIVVERAMYSSANGVFWAAGTDAVATRLR